MKIQTIGQFMSKIYTGIGSRSTPIEIKNLMTEIAKILSKKDFTLRSGGADGADDAFEIGAIKKEIYLPVKYFNGRIADNQSYFNYQLCEGKDAANEMVEKYHPNPKLLTKFAFLLMARNSMQVFGRDMKTPTNYVICWTQNGKDIGGTRQAIAIAKDNNIPVYNLGLSEIHDKFSQWVSEETK